MRGHQIVVNGELSATPEAQEGRPFTAFDGTSADPAQGRKYDVRQIGTDGIEVDTHTNETGTEVPFTAVVPERSAP